MQWNLDDTVTTRAGRVAAGHAGSGDSLVLMHGWPWSSYAWHRVIPELAKHYHVYWYDMPGYGRSEKTVGQRTSLDVQAVVFNEMLEHWQLSNPDVVAHDVGGAITLRAHLLLGQEFHHYVLMNVVALRPWGSAFFDHVGKHIEAFMGLPPHIHEAVVRAYILGAMVNTLPGDDLEKLVEPWLSDSGKTSFYQQFAQADECYTAELEPHFGSIRCPCSILWGEADPWIPLQRGQALHALMPASTFTPLPEAGHLPQLENPELVLKELLQALSA